MLQYLRIFSWFLLTFGVVGFGATAFGVDIGIGTGPAALKLLALQVLVAIVIQLGFRRCHAGKLSRRALSYGGWSLILLYVIGGTVVMNLS